MSDEENERFLREFKASFEDDPLVPHLVGYKGQWEEESAMRLDPDEREAMDKVFRARLAGDHGGIVISLNDAAKVTAAFHEGTPCPEMVEIFQFRIDALQRELEWMTSLRDQCAKGGPVKPKPVEGE